MKKLLALIVTLTIFAFPHSTNAAVALGNSSSGNTAGLATSLSFSHTATGDTMLVVMLTSRLGCTATDITNVAVTYNGVAMSFATGTAGTSIFSGDCAHSRLLYLPNPSTGANTLAASWTSNAYVSMIARSFSGADTSLGTLVWQNTAAANWTVTASISTGDMLLAMSSFSDVLSQLNSTESNYLEVGDGNQQTTSATDVGNGSVTVNGTARAFGHLTLGVPILAASGGGGSPSTEPQDVLMFE
jgi:hypothetical protein